LPRRAVTVKVEPGLADRGHSGVARVIAQGGEIAVRSAPRLARVNADAQEDVRAAAGERERARHDLGRVRDLDEVGDPGRDRPVARLVAVPVETLVAERTVGVDPANGPAVRSPRLLPPLPNLSAGEDGGSGPGPLPGSWPRLHPGVPCPDGEPLTPRWP